MLVLFAVIFGGIVTGRLLQSRRLAFVSRLIAVIIWALLFLLGLEVGSDPAVVGGMATLGRTAFVIFVFSVAGSIGASWLLWRRIRGRSASGTEGTGANPASAGSVSGRELGTGGGGCGANCSSGTVADPKRSRIRRRVARHALLNLRIQRWVACHARPNLRSRHCFARRVLPNLRNRRRASRRPRLLVRHPIRKSRCRCGMH